MLIPNVNFAKVILFVLINAYISEFVLCWNYLVITQAEWYFDSGNSFNQNEIFLTVLTSPENLRAFWDLSEWESWSNILDIVSFDIILRCDKLIIFDQLHENF